MIRFGSSSPQLQARSGFLGTINMPLELEHLHATAIRDATETVLKEFASPSCPVPFSKIARTKFTKFLPRFLPKVAALTADGASDEQLALSMMFDGGGFPNLKVITRDLAHSMRRVASRTSFADPYLRKVFLSKNSKC